MGQIISNKQNEEKNIKKLAAQSQIYTDAKKLFRIQLYITVGIPVIISLITLLTKLIAEIDYSWINVFIALIIFLLDQFYFVVQINKLKQLAAKIQELFDCDVLDIEWYTMVGEQPDTEDIYKYSAKYLQANGNYEYFKDWYGKSIEDIPEGVDKIICQRSNVKYDHEIRSEFIKYIGSICIAPFIILFIVICITDPSASGFCKYFIAPIFPIVKLYVQIYNSHKKSLSILEKLKQKANSIWKQTLEGKVIDINKSASNFQYEIYLNRKESSLIFDKFYFDRRDKYEDIMAKSLNELIKEYKQNIKL